MAKVTVSGVGPTYDGEYDLDFLESLNGNELHLIKKVAGVRLGEIDEAMAADDYDLYVSLAAIALWRNGKVTKQTVMLVVDLMLAAEAGVVRFDWSSDAAGGEGDDASPPARLPSGNEPPPNNDESSQPSSETSPSTGEDPPAMTLVSTGAQG